MLLDFRDAFAKGYQPSCIINNMHVTSQVGSYNSVLMLTNNDW